MEIFDLKKVDLLKFVASNSFVVNSGFTSTRL